jgi:hypothetical protein
LAPPLQLELTMSNPAFESLSPSALVTATGGVASTTSDCTLRQSLRPILSSLRELGTSSANNQSQQQNQTMMMTMMAMMSRR